jgi:hypothetical protein
MAVAAAKYRKYQRIFSGGNGVSISVHQRISISLVSARKRIAAILINQRNVGSYVENGGNISVAPKWPRRSVMKWRWHQQ